MTPAQSVLCIALVLAVLTGLAAPLVFVGQGPAQAAVTLRSGVYCDGLRAACTQSFATWRGEAVHSTLTFFPDATWSDIEGPDWWYSGWLSNPYAKMAVVTIPMLPARGTTADPTPTLASGAKGSYNEYWKVVAQRLVATGMGGVTLRLGHELNGSWYRWSAQKNPAAYAAYWRQIVTTMRSVAGAKFTFDWNVAVGIDAWDATSAWPGDSYVDTVGQDVYDQKWGDSTATPAVRWNALVSGGSKFHQGMAFWASFATAHGKPSSFAEWALVASGASMANGGEGKDDPYYIQKMHDWFASHATAFEIYFDRTAPDGDHVINGGKFPQAAALYQNLFSSPTTTPSPTATATATATVKPSSSAPSSSASSTASSSSASAAQSSSAASSSAASSEVASSGVTSSDTASSNLASSNPASSNPASSDAVSSDPAGPDESTTADHSSSSPATTSSATADPTPSVSDTPTPTVSSSASQSAPSPGGSTTTVVSRTLAFRVSAHDDRSGAVSLAGRTLRSSRYVYVVAPSATSVAFYLDDRARAHRPLQVEHSAPFDLRGTFYGKARPWKVSGVVTGPHTLTVVATLSNGTKLVKSVRFHVSGKANPAYRTGFSVTRHAARTHAHGLAGHALRGKVYVYLSARRLAGVASVTFYVDDPHHKYPAARRDRHRPFDLVGSSGSRAVALDTRLMLRGSHTVQAVIRWRDGTVTARLVHFRVVR